MYEVSSGCVPAGLPGYEASSQRCERHQRDMLSEHFPISTNKKLKLRFFCGLFGSRFLS